MTFELRDRENLFDANLPGSAVIVHKVDTRRPQPAWVIDRNDPIATYSNNAGSMLLVGQQLVDAQGEFSLRVLSETATGYEIEVHVTQPIFNSEFGSGT